MAQAQVDRVYKNLAAAFITMEEPLPPEEFISNKEELVDRGERITTELLNMAQRPRGENEDRELSQIIDAALDLEKEYSHQQKVVSNQEELVKSSTAVCLQEEPPVFIPPTVVPMGEEFDFTVYLQ